VNSTVRILRVMEQTREKEESKSDSTTKGFGRLLEKISKKVRGGGDSKKVGET